MGEVYREQFADSLAYGANFSGNRDSEQEDDQQQLPIATQEDVNKETPVDEEEKKDPAPKVVKQQLIGASDVGNDDDVETIEHTSKKDSSNATPGSLSIPENLEDLDRLSNVEEV